MVCRKVTMIFKAVSKVFTLVNFIFVKVKFVFCKGVAAIYTYCRLLYVHIDAYQHTTNRTFQCYVILCVVNMLLLWHFSTPEYILYYFGLKFRSEGLYSYLFPQHIVCLYTYTVLPSIIKQIVDVNYRSSHYSIYIPTSFVFFLEFFLSPPPLPLLFIRLLN